MADRTPLTSPTSSHEAATQLDTCSYEDCTRRRYCRGWCRRHYDRWLRHGDPGICHNPHLPASERFVTKYEIAPTGCWLWTSVIDGEGYGDFWDGSKNLDAHRWSYEHHVGAVPPGLHLDHLCRVRHCVNPDHLEPVTAGENVLRGVGPSAVNAAKTHCKRGHPFAGRNLKIIATTGERRCRECARLRDAGYRERRKVVAHG